MKSDCYGPALGRDYRDNHYIRDWESTKRNMTKRKWTPWNYAKASYGEHYDSMWMDDSIGIECSRWYTHELVRTVSTEQTTETRYVFQIFQNKKIKKQTNLRLGEGNEHKHGSLSR